ncbi:hypothetical protein ACH5RR_003894 [Cinchona calisaya]|uniref:Transposase MuDR plant domain-containing protein n=1 Tax=Cinchona calisaya TaxID=153742 RepID=A0ABD3AW33_9GENT
MLFFHDGENSDDEHESRMPSKAKKLSLARPSIDKGKKIVNDANDGSCSDIENMNSSANSDCEGGLTKFPVFYEKRDMDNLKLKLGMIFKDVKVFRAALRENSIKEGYEFRFVKNDGNRVTVVCDDECPWRIHASKMQGSNTFQIKTMK